MPCPPIGVQHFNIARDKPFDLQSVGSSGIAESASKQHRDGFPPTMPMPSPPVMASEPGMEHVTNLLQRLTEMMPNQATEHAELKKEVKEMATGNNSADRFY